LLLGGGCGIAPLLLLAKQLKKAGAEPHIVLGGRSKQDIVRQKEFAKYGKVLVTTEDGSLGSRGYVTEVFKKLTMSEYKMLYTCGPEAMLKGIYRYAHEQRLPLQVSLESMMACGFGVCLCCVTPSKTEGHVCVCKDGPVFNAEQLSW
jgi:dihydroorotate dehydrogenase electron transfer subunit